MTRPTDLYCVMGNPVEHSRSPWIHARFAELTGQALAYERRLVPLDGFGAALRDFAQAGGRGCNITVPFKLEAAQAASVRSERVQLAGAANTLSFIDGAIHADNTDGLGLVADIEQGADFALAGRDVLLVGAGGAAAGALGPLLAAGPRRVVVANRTLERAQALVQSHAALAALQKTELSAQSPQALEHDFDLIINATASSLILFRYQSFNANQTVPAVGGALVARTLSPFNLNSRSMSQGTHMSRKRTEWPSK